MICKSADDEPIVKICSNEHVSQPSTHHINKDLGYNNSCRVWITEDDIRFVLNDVLVVNQEDTLGLLRVSRDDRGSRTFDMKTHGDYELDYAIRD
jgi:hypothetical protein